MAVAAGGQHFYMAFSAEGVDSSCSCTTANTNPHTGEQGILPGQGAGTVLDLTSPGQKKNTGIIQDWKTCLTVGGLKAFFSLARRELGGELVIIHNQVLERCFLAEGCFFYGTEQNQDLHAGS